MAIFAALLLKEAVLWFVVIALIIALAHCGGCNRRAGRRQLCQG